jgi:hypothetical protein
VVRTGLETFLDVLMVILICILENGKGERGYISVTEYYESDITAIVWWVVLSFFTFVFVVFMTLVSCIT